MTRPESDDSKRSVVNVQEAKENPRSILNPCSIGQHRWAWLTDGRQACGYCGRRR